jgi:hypothetical protein
LARSSKFFTDEAAQCSNACLQVGKIGQFGAKIEGNVCGIGQRALCLNEPVHSRLRLPVIVAQEDGETADVFDQRRDIGLAELPALWQGGYGQHGKETIATDPSYHGYVRFCGRLAF